MRVLLLLLFIGGCANKMPKEVDEAMLKASQAERELIEAIKKKRYLDSRV